MENLGCEKFIKAFFFFSKIVGEGVSANRLGFVRTVHTVTKGLSPEPEQIIISQKGIERQGGWLMVMDQYGRARPGWFWRTRFQLCGWDERTVYLIIQFLSSPQLSVLMETSPQYGQTKVTLFFSSFLKIISTILYFVFILGKEFQKFKKQSILTLFNKMFMSLFLKYIQQNGLYIFFFHTFVFAFGIFRYIK